MQGDIAELARRVGQGLASGTIANKADLQKTKQEAASAFGIAVPPDSVVAAAMSDEVRRKHGAILRTKPMRSASGVAIIAVMSSPASCPHGKCTFCPGGPEVDAPQSYTGFEPSTMRAKRYDYDPYRIVRGRLEQLVRNGHAVDKVDIVIQGGTFPAREESYQDWFVAGIYAGLNDGPAPPGSKDAGREESWESEADWTLLQPHARDVRLRDLMKANETAQCRAIGLTIETKPDWCFEEHLDGMLRRGATRVEIGLQTLDDDVLRATHRGHDLADSRRAMQAARDAGFKICAHMMPGLPRDGRLPVAETTEPAEALGSALSARSATGRGAAAAHLITPVELPTVGRFNPDPAKDVADMRDLFTDPAWRPDMLKIYPTLVVMEGETGLKRMWQRKEYEPYDSAAAAAVVGESKGFVPEYCRIQRIDRDIPTTHVEAGVMNSNLRQIAQAWRRERNLPECRCIRCREAGTRARSGVDVRMDRVVLRRAEYEASSGTEVFLSFEDPVADAVVAFLRLRKVSPKVSRVECDVLGGAAFVRELKVYGIVQPINATPAVVDDPEVGSFQHQGLGARLLAEAERIAFTEWTVGRLLVIAGPGVKPYYRRHGYSDCGPYVAKERTP